MLQHCIILQFLNSKKFWYENNFFFNNHRLLEEHKGHPEILNINCVDPLNRSALIAAIENENADLINLLLDLGIQVKVNYCILNIIMHHRKLNSKKLLWKKVNKHKKGLSFFQKGAKIINFPGFFSIPNNAWIHLTIKYNNPLSSKCILTVWSFESCVYTFHRMLSYMPLKKSTWKLSRSCWSGRKGFMLPDNHT